MHLLVHYSEIALKGKNRGYFEKKLAENIKKAIKGSYEKTERPYGRIVVKLTGSADLMNIKKTMSEIPGISWFAFASDVESNIDKIKEEASKILYKKETEMRANEKTLKTYKVSVKRADKKFPLTSQEATLEVADYIYQIHPMKADMKNPELEICVEITNKGTFIFSEKICGSPGLPVGSSGKVLVLLSGGIDSAVAAYMVMKRGCRCEFLHFHAVRNGEEVMESKIKKIVEILNKYSRSSMIHTVPYHNFALEHVPDKLDVILFRRFMIRIAEKIALQNNCKAIVLGDAIGQVASQTLENIANLEGIISLPILRPLLTYDKNEIINLARGIETYDVSIQDYKDCCSIISRRPSTAASPEKIKEAEASIDMEKLIAKTLEQEEKFIIKEEEAKKVHAAEKTPRYLEK